MESKTTKIIALIAFGISMFLLGRVTDCGKKCGWKKNCVKQSESVCGKSGASSIDIHALVGDDFEGDTIIFITDDEISKEIRIERRVEIDSEHGHDH